MNPLNLYGAVIKSREIFHAISYDGTRSIARKIATKSVDYITSLDANAHHTAYAQALRDNYTNTWPLY